MNYETFKDKLHAIDFRLRVKVVTGFYVVESHNRLIASADKAKYDIKFYAGWYEHKEKQAIADLLAECIGTDVHDVRIANLIEETDRGKEKGYVYVVTCRNDSFVTDTLLVAETFKEAAVYLIDEGHALVGESKGYWTYEKRDCRSDNDWLPIVAWIRKMKIGESVEED